MLLLTRPLSDSLVWQRRLHQEGITSLIAPAFSIRLQDISPNIPACDGYILTSKYALPALKRLPPAPVWAVGEVVAEMLADSAFTCTPFTDSTALITGLQAVTPARLLYLRGATISTPITGTPHQVIERIAYDTVPETRLPKPVIAALSTRQIDYISYFSTHTLTCLEMAAGSNWPLITRIPALCLSETIAKAAIVHGHVRAEAAQDPTGAAMMALISQQMKKHQE